MVGLRSNHWLGNFSFFLWLCRLHYFIAWNMVSVFCWISSWPWKDITSILFIRVLNFSSKNSSHLTFIDNLMDRVLSWSWICHLINWKGSYFSCLLNSKLFPRFIFRHFNKICIRPRSYKFWRKAFSNRFIKLCPVRLWPIWVWCLIASRAWISCLFRKDWCFKQKRIWFRLKWILWSSDFALEVK